MCKLYTRLTAERSNSGGSVDAFTLLIASVLRHLPPLLPVPTAWSRQALTRIYTILAAKKHHLVLPHTDFLRRPTILDTFIVDRALITGVCSAAFCFVSEWSEDILPHDRCKMSSFFYTPHQIPMLNGATTLLHHHDGKQYLS